jgi:dihydrodipicolinate synthase/N-acetylneuraminate lyase
MKEKMMEHDFKEALETCDRWLGHIEQQKQNSVTLQKAAALARKGDMAEARRLKNQVDTTPRIFDGANFIDVMPQIQFALRLAERMQSGEVSEGMLKAGKKEMFEEAIFKAMTKQLMKEIEGE